MTMDGIVLNALVAAAVLAVVGAALSFVPWRTQQIKSMTVHRERFYRATQNLIDDTSTPSVVIELMGFFVNQVDKPTLGRITADWCVAG
jgi:UDP-N-acetylmuramyl pentapeptide synthase